MAKKRMLWKKSDDSVAGFVEYTASMHITSMRVWNVFDAWHASFTLECGYTEDSSEAFPSMISARRWAEKEAWKRLTTIRNAMVRDFDLDIKRLTGAIKKHTPKRRKRRKAASNA